jgi:hypothetical protein
LQVSFSGQIFDAGYWMSIASNARLAQSMKIEYPETSIEHQPQTARSFDTTD